MAAGRGAVVSGPPASGVSTVLRAVCDELRATGRSVVSRRAGDARDVQSVVVIDDAQRLDDETIDALAAAALVGEQPIVIGTTSTTPAIGRLRSSGDLLTIDLTPLDGSGVAALVAGLVGATPDGATSRVLAEDSGGLPGLLAPTVLAALAEPGCLSISAGVARLRGRLPIASAVTERIAARRAGLSTEGAAVVEAVCVGRELSVSTSVEVFGLDPLSEAERAGLVATDGIVVRAAVGAVGRVVRAELGTFGMARVARTLAAAIDDAPLDRMVHWQVLAGHDPGLDTLTNAAVAAQERGDLSVAHDLAERAWRGGGMKAGVLLAEVLSATGDRTAAALVLDDLLGRDDLADELRAAAALELATLHLWNFGQPRRAIELATLASEITAGTPFDSLGRGALGAMLGYSGHAKEALATVEPCLRDDTPGHTFSSQVAATALAITGDTARAVEIGRAGLRASVDGPVQPTDLDPELHVVSLTLALELAGRLDEAERLTSDWYERAAERSVHHAWVALARMRLMLVRGRLHDAARFAGEAAAIFRDLDNHAPCRWAVAGRLLAEAQMANESAVRSSLHDLDELGPSGITFLDTDVARARSWALAADGHLDDARSKLVEAADDANDAGLHTLAACALHDVARLGGAATIAGLLEATAARVDSVLVSTHARHARAIVDDDDGALLTIAEEYGTRRADLFAIEAAARAATIADRRGDRIAGRRATALLRELPRCDEAVTPALVDVKLAPLSPREREVARLASSGLTSREIGARLHLSVRTVDNVLQRSYAKLGIAGRRELRDAIRSF